MKDFYETKNGSTIQRELVILEAEDVNDPCWNPIVKVLNDNGFQVYWADGNYMNIVISEQCID